jgi:hypothetical protein
MASSFSRLQAKAYERTLKPQGFVVSKGMYVRSAGAQWVAVEFQRGRQRDTYFVNLAFQYAFSRVSILPGHSAVRHGADGLPVPLAARVAGAGALESVA